MMTNDERARMWAQFMAAAIAGMFSSETETFSYGHRAEIARPASAAADAALAEYEKRFNVVVRHA